MAPRGGRGAPRTHDRVPLPLTRVVVPLDQQWSRWTNKSSPDDFVGPARNLRAAALPGATPARHGETVRLRFPGRHRRATAKPCGCASRGDTGAPRRNRDPPRNEPPARAWTPPSTPVRSNCPAAALLPRFGPGDARARPSEKRAASNGRQTLRNVATLECAANHERLTLMIAPILFRVPHSHPRTSAPALPPPHSRPRTSAPALPPRSAPNLRQRMRFPVSPLRAASRKSVEAFRFLLGTFLPEHSSVEAFQFTS